MNIKNSLIFFSVSIVVLIFAKIILSPTSSTITNQVKPEETQNDSTKVVEHSINEKEKDSKTFDKKSSRSINMYDLANKNIEDVEKVLGKHEDIDKGNFVTLDGNKYPVVSYYFDNDTHRVMFHKGKSIRITVSVEKDTYKFPDDAKDALHSVGLTGIKKIDSTSPNTKMGRADSYKIDDFYEAIVWRKSAASKYINQIQLVVDENYK